MNFSQLGWASGGPRSASGQISIVIRACNEDDDYDNNGDDGIGNDDVGDDDDDDDYDEDGGDDDDRNLLFHNCLVCHGEVDKGVDQGDAAGEEKNLMLFLTLLEIVLITSQIDGKGGHEQGEEEVYKHG